MSAGHDIYSIEPIVLKPYKTEVISARISVELKARTSALVIGRSSLSAKGILTHSGLIDPWYSKDLKVILTNLSGEDIHLDQSSPIAQFIVIPTALPQLISGITLKPGRTSTNEDHGTVYDG
jgi:dUTP pyrophosphatase